MSKAWAKGSTPAWRRLRQYVLTRDAWVCQLCELSIDPMLRHPDPMSAQVHHTLEREVAGDDPRYLQAAHRECNLKAGQPGKRSPQPRRVSSW
ncbi:hypothetical protein CLV30_109184 [Haloactinopolyspora alba]|uniref:HNH endonuclease n=1 Tax=Haloactinopolyspora alba TaxID=648780 RepID=A0A2P8E080_9ACTN|nr:hypothetical protein [Haloactinopolyspora alba]PSL02876.1 hypothetical protein CLV30_109184 [Haloactinopolyspora alba]